MNTNAERLRNDSRNWLQTSVFPLWLKQGIDPKNGSFVESLDFQGQPTPVARRAMVQARQIYALTEALKMNILDASQVRAILKPAMDFFVEKYSLPSGAFLHAVTADGSPDNLQSELYTQAFALFGLARAYEVLRDPALKTRAKALLQYLNQERRAPYGGYTEVKNGGIKYQSNPHMHLFEAALAWATIDNDADWKTLAHGLFELCKAEFIDAETGALAEHFDEDWKPVLTDERFIFEPGHHYEWAWLLVQFEKLSKISTGALPEQLYQLAETYGVRKPEGITVDEVWSNFKIHKSSARFWPQTERVKAAVELGLRAPLEEQAKYAAAADEAMKALWLYLDRPLKGTWEDTLSETGEFIPLAPKASSLYHIICAMSEYEAKRPLLNDTPAKELNP